MVPPQAIQRSSAGEAQAFVVDDAGKVALKPLRTGPLTEHGWIVEDGLAPGEQLVVEGFQKIHPGGSARAVPWVAPTTAPPTTETKAASTVAPITESKAAPTTAQR